MKKIAIFQSDLNVGGIQKSLINLLNDIDMDCCQVDLYLFDRACFFDMPEHENLNVIYLKPYMSMSRIVPFGILRKLFPVVKTDKEYDVAIDFNSYRSDCAAGAIGVKAEKRLMWIHNDVEIKLQNEPKYRVLWHFFKGKLKYYDEFCAVSPGIIDSFRHVSGIHDKPVNVIPNHIDTREIFEKAARAAGISVDPACYNLCSMGRICHQKGFDLLMDILAQVRPKRPDMHFYLMGDGPDRSKLEAQIERLSLGDMVTLLGNQVNPFPILDQMDGFVLTSRYEGQGMVIREAQALGLELFISENLEKYNPGISGRSDMVAALCGAVRHEKHRDDLSGYNLSITESLCRILEL